MSASIFVHLIYTLTNILIHSVKEMIAFEQFVLHTSPFGFVLSLLSTFLINSSSGFILSHIESSLNSIFM